VLPLLLSLALAAPISSIDVKLGGVGWTRESAVLRLLSTRVGDEYDPATLKRDLSRLRTLGVLYDVAAKVSDDRTSIEVDAKDRWAIFPVVGFRRGGGRTTSRFGVSDHNALFRLFTVYGELSSNADVPFTDGRFGSYVFAEAPRSFGTRFQPGIYWTRDFVDYAAFSSAGAPGYVYDRARHDLRFELHYDLTDEVALIGGADVLHDRFVNSDASHAQGTAPPDADNVAAVAGVQLGFVEQDLSMSRGRELKVLVEASRGGVLGTRSSVTSGSITARGFFVPVPGQNFCAQLSLLGTTGRTDSFLFRAGGLREIRGFSDAAFEGQVLLRGNLEHRVDVGRPTFVIPAIAQLAAFVDGGLVARRADAVAGMDYEGPIASVGVGGRYIPIPFAHAVGRLDFAVGLVPRRTFDISVSGQQFF
jgi:hypothetical protein